MHGFEEQEYSKQFDMGLWRKLLRYAKPYQKHLIALGIVMVLVASLDAFFPQMTRIVIDRFIVPGTLEGIGWYAAGFGALVAVQALNVFALIYLAGKIEMGIVYDLRRAGFHHLQRLSFSYYDRTPVGWLMARMTSDAQRLGEVISWGLVDIVWGSTMMIAIAGFMIGMHARLALVVLSVVPILGVISVFFQRRILKEQREVRKTNSRISGAYNEGIMGAKTTKTLVREEENLSEFRELTSKMRSSSIRSAVLSALFLPVVLTLGSIGTALALWLGGLQVAAGALTFGVLAAFLSYTVQFFEPVREVARVFAELQSAQASAERIMSMLDTEPEIVDSEDVETRFGTATAPMIGHLPRMRGEVEFRDVTFRYKEGETVLENFNLHVRAGETIAFVGETGSGKSTIVNLACRFYEPTEGTILVDGHDYRERSVHYHQSHLGYVLQAPHLFSGTVRDNIRYGRLEATDEEVEQAARLVSAHEVIAKLENGYDTEVGEGGGMLSVGEKQLVSFARAVLADPVIFVLDEATSSIDTETELLIQSAIERVLHDRTSFIIAHRLSTIRSADRIIVLQNGVILEEGTHDELVAEGGYYYRLYTNQFLEEQEDAVLAAER